MNLLTSLNSTIASLLDSAAVHAHKVLPISGAWVGYTPNLSFRIDAWKEGHSLMFQAGGFEVCIDV